MRQPDVDVPANCPDQRNGSAYGIGPGPAEALWCLGAGLNPGLAGPSMAAALHSAQRRNPGALLADDLNPERRVFYLLETLDAATQSGLTYMGDASL
jgi:hypothetical protein